MPSHSGSSEATHKPHACPYGRGFRRKEHLVRHQAFHRRRLPYLLYLPEVLHSRVSEKRARRGAVTRLPTREATCSAPYPRPHRDARARTTHLSGMQRLPRQERMDSSTPACRARLIDPAPS